MARMDPSSLVSQPKPLGTANCPTCGRFARVIHEHTEYDGNFDQLYVTTACVKCGEITEGVI